MSLKVPLVIVFVITNSKKGCVIRHCRLNAAKSTFSSTCTTSIIPTGYIFADEKVFTDFDLLEKSLGENCDQNLLSLLKSMLDPDKRKRKKPSELLSHPFISMGEQHLETERKMLKYEEKIQVC